MLSCIGVGNLQNSVYKSMSICVSESIVVFGGVGGGGKREREREKEKSGSF